MEKHHFKKALFTALAASLLCMGVSGCGTLQDNIDKVRNLIPVSVSENAASDIPEADLIPPVIEAADLTIPYGTFLHLQDTASISDDTDPSPLLEIKEVIRLDQDEPADTEDADEETASEDPVPDEADEEEAFSLAGQPADTEESGAETDTESAYEESITEADTLNADIMDAPSESEESNAETAPDEAEDSVSEENADAEAADLNTEAETDPNAETEEGPGYLFSLPGIYNMDLLGTDISGNLTQKSITVTVIDTIPPVLAGLQESYVMSEQDKVPLNYMEGVSAADEIDGDVTASVTVDDSEVEYGTPGIYSIHFSVSDTSENTVTETVSVTIEDTTAPVITLSEDSFDLFVTDSAPDYAFYVTAEDTVDGDVKDTLIVDDSAVQYSHPGTYAALVSAEDRSGNIAQASMEVIISAGWTSRDGETFYYSTEDGHLYHSWSKIGDKKYYFDPSDGHMLTDWQDIDGRTYYFSPDDGHMYRSWSNINGFKYYFSPDDGHMYRDWSRIDNKKYYFDTANGYMLTGWQDIGNRTYYFAPGDGHMYQNWSTIEGSKYYFAPGDGHMYTGWSQINGFTYYFDPKDGQMYTSTHTIGSEEYDFGSDGIARKVTVPQRSTVSDSSSNDTYGDYIANKNTGVFHHSWCASVRTMKDHNKVYFDSRNAVTGRGYRPCQKCNP